MLGATSLSWARVGVVFVVEYRDGERNEEKVEPGGCTRIYTDVQKRKIAKLCGTTEKGCCEPMVEP